MTKIYPNKIGLVGIFLGSLFFLSRLIYGDSYKWAYAILFVAYFIDTAWSFYFGAFQFSNEKLVDSSFPRKTIDLQETFFAHVTDKYYEVNNEKVTIKIPKRSLSPIKEQQLRRCLQLEE